MIMRNLLFLLVILMAACTQKSEISQWRGVNRDGVYNETGLLKSWPENGPEMLWSNENVGNGYGAPTITNDCVYVNGEIDSMAYLIALDHSGRELWKSKNGKGFVQDGFVGRFPGARTAPTVVNDLVYSMSGYGRLACYQTVDGKEIWAKDLIADLGGIINSFGYAESPIIEGDKVFCFPGGSKNNAVALNRLTGEVIWTSSALKDTISYCSPMIVELPQRKVLVNFSTKNLLGLDVETGELLWSQKQEKRKYDQQCNTPVFYKNHLYYVAGDGNGVVKLALSEDGSEITESWSNYIGHNSFYGFLIKNDKLFTTDRAKLFSLDIETGEPIDTVNAKQGTSINAGDFLYYYANNGQVKLLDISGNKMVEVSEFKFDLGTREHFSTPVIHNGVIYIRRGEAMAAYNIME